ncbi:HAD family hydrolase [Bacillus sp. V3-13]|uniref:HAD family hydrolase n=1 Tax=Bacillus sp. V3-13 TaxID=2053728 RepID=UPI000C772E05|nr:HAD family hydrolase [Bacillus sp. V3-13]PLR75712.1 HAD family hydrolase [Bacillus sp. V3-13]
MIKAIIFDFDGTIIDTESLWYRVFKEVLEEDYGVGLPLEQFAKVIGTTDELLYEYINSQMAKPIAREELTEKVSKKFTSYEDVLLLREGVHEVMDEAKDLGLKIAIASSSHREWIDGFLDKFQLNGYFETIKTKEDVTTVKPDPALYLEAIKELGVKAEEALAIEDSVNGSLAAVKAGLHCVVIPNDVTSFMAFHEQTIRYDAFSMFKIHEFLKQLS